MSVFFSPSQEKNMARERRTLKAKEDQVTVRKAKQQIAQVEYTTKAYEEWKADQEAEAAKEIAKMQKQAEGFKAKAALEQARAEGYHLKIKTLKAQYKVREAGELRSKKQAVTIKERRVKIKNGLLKANNALEAEQLEGKIQGLLGKEKANMQHPDSKSVKSAEAGLKKTEAMLKKVKGDVNQAMSSATREAVHNAKALAKAEKMKLEGRAGKDGKNKSNTPVNPNKKCGPGVKCTVYQAVVKKAGGAKKYYKLEADELLKLKRANIALPNSQQKDEDALKMEAFQILGKRFDITAPKPACMKGPAKAIPCERYDNTVKQTGGAGKFEKAYAKALRKLKKKSKIAPGAKVPMDVKMAAFDKVADFAGLAKGVMKPEMVKKMPKVKTMSEAEKGAKKAKGKGKAK